jgi:hypothetical protein
MSRAEHVSIRSFGNDFIPRQMVRKLFVETLLLPVTERRDRHTLPLKKCRHRQLGFLPQPKPLNPLTTLPLVSFFYQIILELRTTANWSLISVCSRDQAAIQIDTPPGALTPRMSVIVWPLFFEPEPSLERPVPTDQLVFTRMGQNDKLKTGYSCDWC